MRSVVTIYSRGKIIYEVTIPGEVEKQVELTPNFDYAETLTLYVAKDKRIVVLENFSPEDRCLIQYIEDE